MKIKRGYSHSYFGMIRLSIAGSKCSQVWVETVIYTLIGLTIMAIIIGVITPKINQITDKTILTQTRDTLNQLNDQVQETLSTVGSQREVALTVKRGQYMIDGPNNNIYYSLLGTSALISQPGIPVKDGELTILTEMIVKNKYNVFLILNYSSYNVTYNGKDVNKTLTPAPTSYRLLLINRGSPSSDARKQIDIQSIGG
jgi:type II secretory pathway pseudopilin PulG